MPNSAELDTNDYRALAEFRYRLRKFLRFSEETARAAAVEPQHYQLLLAAKGLPDGTRATVGELAERLQILHHSAVELIDRLAEQGLVQRRRSDGDRRQVLVTLTARGERTLRDLAVHHHEQLQVSGPELLSALRRLVTSTQRKQPQNRPSTAGAARAVSAPRRAASPRREVATSSRQRKPATASASR